MSEIHTSKYKKITTFRGTVNVELLYHILSISKQGLPGLNHLYNSVMGRSLWHLPPIL